MSKVFDLNNPVWTFIGKLVDAMILHIVWLVCCIPVITIGPATIALHYALMKDVADEDAHYVKAFFRSFKENFKQGVALGLIYLLIGAGLTFALYFYVFAEVEASVFWQICRGMTIAFILIYIFSALYVFPLMARFANTVFGTIKNSLILSAKHIGWTLLMTVVLVAPYLILFFTNFVPILLLGYGLVVYINSYILNHVFEPYIAELRKNEPDPDDWTIPEEELRAAEEAAASGVTPIPQGYLNDTPVENKENE